MVVEGRLQHVLGIWLADSEGARFCGSVPAEPGIRGIRGVAFVRCDGLRYLPGAIGEPSGTVMPTTWTGHGATAADAAPTYEGVTELAAAMPTASARAAG